MGGEPPPRGAQPAQPRLGSAQGTRRGRLITEGRTYRLRPAMRWTPTRSSGSPPRAGCARRSPSGADRAFGDLAGEPALRAAAARLDERRLEVLEDHFDNALGGRDADLVAELDALVAAHPLRERLRGQQMLALYRAGRQAEALEAYAAARRALVASSGWSPARRCASCNGQFSATTRVSGARARAFAGDSPDATPQTARGLLARARPRRGRRHRGRRERRLGAPRRRSPRSARRRGPTCWPRSIRRATAWSRARRSAPRRSRWPSGTGRRGR